MARSASSSSASPPPSQHSQPQQLSENKPPERSRNAKAQARHRAKRKAYIEQLEQTVTKLQTVLALSPDQVAALPPPSARIRQLEHENQTLRAEIDELRRHFQSSMQPQPHLTRRTSIVPNDAHFDLGRREPPPTYVASDDYPRQLKRRRSSPEEPYLSPDQTPSPPAMHGYARAPPHYSTPSYLATPTTTASTSPTVPAAPTPSTLLSAYALPPPTSHVGGHPSYSQPASSPTAYDSLAQAQQQHQHQIHAQQAHAQIPSQRYPVHTPTYENVKVEDDGTAYLSTSTTGYFSQPTELAWGAPHHAHHTAYVGAERH